MQIDTKRYLYQSLGPASYPELAIIETALAVAHKEHTVTITLERFAGGETFAEVRERIIREGGNPSDNLTASERALAAATINVEAFRRQATPLRVFVLSEDWCGDCTDNLPLLNRIAEESGKLDLRILSRDANLDIADSHLNRGEFRSVPLIVILDEGMNEIGHFSERPDSVTELRAQKRQAIYASNPAFGSPDAPPAQLPEETRAALQKELMAMREEVRPFAIQEFVRELSAIAERAS